jgi:hypothetical protein
MLASAMARRLAAGTLVAAGAALPLAEWSISATSPATALVSRTPGTAVLALAWERTYCPECELQREASASEANARARAPR